MPHGKSYHTHSFFSKEEALPFRESEGVVEFQEAIILLQPDNHPFGFTPELIPAFHKWGISLLETY
jgi:hypothetical protein